MRQFTKHGKIVWISCLKHSQSKHFGSPLIRLCRFTTPVRCHTIIQCAVVGSGPAGMYCAQRLLKGLERVKIDIYESLPVPFGLVRYGVAPDHPEVKNVTNTFTSILSEDRVEFCGNIHIGKDVRTKMLQEAYHIVILSHGADAERVLGIPGESTAKNVISAREFVGWYNGLPQNRCMQNKLDLECEEAVIVGIGNVALDVSRILLSPIDLLAETDITEESLEVLKKSKIRRLTLLARRGPLQVAFTIKEFREMTKIPDVLTIFDQPEMVSSLQSVIPDLPRPRKRLMDLMLQTSKATVPAAKKEFHIRFLHSPTSFNVDEDGKLCSVTCAINELHPETKKVLSTSSQNTIMGGLAMRSIGYQAIPLESELPFDVHQGIYKHQVGRLEGMPGTYCCGWVQTGPEGVILSTMSNAFALSGTILKDLKSMRIEEKPGLDIVKNYLSAQGHPVVSFEGWRKIDAEEQRRGKAKGKPREKMTDVGEMIQIAI
ncbi:unnamed protein product [Darwinula stevensoni]|uniref:NADPH:adrenodoxin oxidoreductase, mitochondrial n=1 Tax=Darwinula stevensoni TaxID=69355 RepID=A0A7R9AB72_9CRUS|nr:unnamed protein product [Darwinula stevensoni]CAG0898791.1 unnamed protein product [Darwinula stevensoni]